VIMSDPTREPPLTTFRDDPPPVKCPECRKAPVAVAGAAYTCSDGHVWRESERTLKFGKADGE